MRNHQPDRDPSWARQAFGSFVELFALAGLAVTQPVLDVFGRAPDLFVFRGADGGDLIAFALIVAVVPALGLWAVEALVGLAGERARRVTHLLFVGGLVLLLALGSLKQAEVTSGVILVGVAAALAVAAVSAYRRWSGVRLWLRVLGVAPLLFVGLFLTASQASELLASQDVASAEIDQLEDPRPIVFLQLDEWPLQTIVDGEGRIDPGLYPNLAALAGDGVWYRNTATAANFTNYAVPAILTGRSPEGDQTAVASEYPENLFTLLAGQYDLDVIETVTRLCPPNLCDDQLVDGAGTAPAEAPATIEEEPDTLRRLLTDARQTFRAMVSPDPDATSPAQTFQNELAVGAAAVSGSGGLSPDAAVDAADDSSASGPYGLPELSLQSVDDLVASIEDDEDPTLHFLHLLLPHTPYLYFPDGSRYTGGPGPTAEGLRDIYGRSDEEAEIALEEQRLILQAAYTDRVIGRIMGRLRETGLYDEAIVVVTADHGIGLTPGGVFRTPLGGEEMPPENYADLYYVPLVMKAPGLEPAGTVSDANVSTIDILPTLVGALGFDLPWSVDGIDLGAETRLGPEKQAAVVTGGFSEGPLTLSDEITFDGDEQLAEVLDHNVDTLFRSDNPAHPLYDIADAGELVGRRIDDLDVDEPSGLTATVEGLGAFAAVDRSTGTVPAHLWGRVQGTEPGDFVVAAVLNGRVAAVSPTWESQLAPHRLEAMLVPEFFVDGENEVELYLVEGPEGERTLSSIQVEG